MDFKSPTTIWLMNQQTNILITRDYADNSLRSYVFIVASFVVHEWFMCCTGYSQ